MFCFVKSLWEEAGGDGDTKVEVGSWERVQGPPQGTCGGMWGSWAGRRRHGGLGILLGRQGLFLPS